MPLVLNGTTGVQDNSGAFVQGTSVASTSGTSIDFTSIPSWVKRITFLFNGVSTNGSSIPIVQLGSTTFTTSGYVGGLGYTGTSTGGGNFSGGFSLSSAWDAANVIYGSMTLINFTSNTWIASYTGGLSSGAFGLVGSGGVGLSGVLDRVRITTVNGTDAFDAGTINILWE